MRRGTTPTQIFNVDVDLTSAEVIYVTYKQRSCIVLEKGIEEMDITPEQILFPLSQEDTLRFKPMLPVQIQIRARFPDGNAIASNIIDTYAEVILKEGVI